MAGGVDADDRSTPKVQAIAAGRTFPRQLSDVRGDGRMASSVDAQDKVEVGVPASPALTARTNEELAWLVEQVKALDCEGGFAQSGFHVLPERGVTVHTPRSLMVRLLSA
jgi:hypothetical protein